jgi:drug/metabolite transporter (DMT)-like permease
MAAIFTVLCFGALLLAPICVYFGNWEDLTNPALKRASLSGGLFALAAVGLYQAFAIGPVRLVAPIIGSYPILSVGLAAWSGEDISALHVVAVLAIVFGITVVAKGDTENSQGAQRQAILWATASAIGFFGSFAAGQAAAALGAELPIILLTRLAGIFTICCIALPYQINLRSSVSQLPLLAAMGALDAVALAVVIYAGTQTFATFASVTASVFGLVTIVLAWAFLKEKITPKQWMGVFLVFLSIIVLGI